MCGMSISVDSIRTWINVNFIEVMSINGSNVGYISFCIWNIYWAEFHDSPKTISKYVYSDLPHFIFDHKL